MKKQIKVLLLAAMLGTMAPGVIFAQANEEVQAEAVGGINSIQGLDVADNGSTIYVRVTFQQPLEAVPGSFSVANPARLAFDFPATANGLGRGVQSVERGDLRSVNIAQVGDRTRLVLNLTRLLAYETQVEGNALVITLTPPAGSLAGSVASESGASFSAQSAVSVGQSVNDINFRRGTGGEGRVVVQLSSADTGIDIQQQGGNLVVTFLKTSLPEHLRRLSDVTDFATPVTNLTAEQTGENVRLTVKPNGLWEHNAYQSDNQFVVEIKRVTEDPNKLVAGAREKYQGDKLSLNFQNIDVRSVLQVIADFTDFNIVTSDSVSGSLTLRLKDVPWDQALDIILQAKGLDKRKSGNVIWIAPADELAARETQQAAARSDLEDREPLVTESFQVNYHKASEISAFLQKGHTGAGSTLSKRGMAAFDDRSNKLFVTDVAARLVDVRRLVTEIDIAPRQVLIESRIVEAEKNYARELGVKLGYGDLKAKNLGDGAQIGFGHSALANRTYEYDSNTGITTVLTREAKEGDPYDPEMNSRWNAYGPGGDTGTKGLASGALFGQMNLTLFNRNMTRFLNMELQAEETDGNIHTISSPRVLTANNVEALIEQGTEIAYREATSSGAASVSFKDAKLSLKVKPQITPDGRLQLMVEVKKDQPKVLSGYAEPAIDTKSVKSEVLIDNGGTVVIGGIYTEDEQNSVTKVPFLGDIPYLGALFRVKNRRTEQKELLVFITPRIVEDSLTLR
ncbi:fimbrial assembly protein PilQ [Betaproteobacteria bacterium]|nr:fimbrial assembly protein PilQ [Betaproteobacteria bacterium]GHU01340.1 fimbrial assembly protein PilQ [Betaproteobacteria bacterium]GHU17319.1 fimbrial assembly protein PilQ [Betaproteobacteria bacterium]